MLPYEAIAEALSQPMLEFDMIDLEGGTVLFPRGTCPTMLKSVPGGGTNILVLGPSMLVDVNVKGTPREVEEKFRIAVNSMIPGELGEILGGPGSEGTIRPEIIGYALHEEGRRIWPEDPNEVGSYADAKIAFAKFDNEGREVTVDAIAEAIPTPPD